MNGSNKGWVLAVTAAWLAVLAAPAAADGTGASGQEEPSREEGLERELERMRAEMEAMRSRIDQLEDAGPLERRIGRLVDEQQGDEFEGEEAPGDFSLRPRASWETGEEIPPNQRGVYDKPFLLSLWRRAYVGGYTELEYHSFEDGVLGIPEGFRAHRTNLFLYADVSDRVRFGSEIEFENEEPGEDLEVNVEMAFVDWVIAEEFSIRGGVVLLPLGRINVNHDGPVRELTDRPMVSTFVIPTTLSDAGVGFHGTAQIAPGTVLAYESYVTNGFDLLDRNGELAAPITEIEQLLREGRPSLGGDPNDSLANTGRISVRTLERTLELGGSWHVGTYDERDDNLLSIVAGDLAFNRGPFALEGEVALARFERNEFAKTAGVPDDFWGLYVQPSASGMPDWLRGAVPYIFDDPGSRFALVARYDFVDLDGDRSSAVEPGISFRPHEDTVFKFSYRFGLNDLGIRDIPGREAFDDDGFVFSLSTYF